MTMQIDKSSAGTPALEGALLSAGADAAEPDFIRPRIEAALQRLKINETLYLAEDLTPSIGRGLLAGEQEQLSIATFTRISAMAFAVSEGLPSLNGTCLCTD